MDKFRKATAVPYGCLVVDLKQDTPDSERLKSGNVFAPLVATTTPLMSSTVATTPPLIGPMMTEATPMRAVDPCTTTAHAQVLPQIGPEVSTADQLAAGRRAEQIRNPNAPAPSDAAPPDQDEMNTTATCHSCGIQFHAPYFLETSVKRHGGRR
jgi:hypothetical protein